MTTTEEKLKLLAENVERRRKLTQWIDDAVLALRSPDMDGGCEASWQEVADALGVSRQAAWRMYRAEDAPDAKEPRR